MVSLRTEKEDLSRDLCEAQEKLKLQSKELKDALQQRKLAMSEYTEVTDKLGLALLRNRDWFIQSTCAVNGQGIVDGLEWLATSLKNKKKSNW